MGCKWQGQIPQESNEALELPGRTMSQWPLWNMKRNSEPIAPEDQYGWGFENEDSSMTNLDKPRSAQLMLIFCCLFVGFCLGALFRGLVRF